ncbi:hypothetical protein [Wolbachia pipientis]|uniref:hypothetical protein n=1 Tax=Wolbachia pipientis TaxID=955 RepID=UPI0025A42D39|nr:hypothetical protein [Wolbachia pipientis]MDM8335023.1 hypothetical protein [Wolbachia pipientis]
MPDNKNQSKEINIKLLAIGAGLLLFVMMQPSIFLLAKIAIGLIMVSVATIAIKIALKTILNVLENKQADQAQAAQQTTQNKIINLAIGLMSIFAAGLSMLIIAKTGLTTACTAVAALVLYEYAKDVATGKAINDKLDKIVGDITNFVVGNIERLVPPQSRQNSLN